MAACEERIPIFPIRYTIKERTSGDPAYSYTESDLETGYPELQHSQYTTRLLREGFVYIYDANKGSSSGLQLWKVNKEGSYTELTSLTTIPDSDKERYKTGSQLSHISACADSTEVYVGFTDTLWTKNKYAAIVANTGGVRDKTMSKINVKEWAGTRSTDGTEKGTDTFPAEKIGSILEEYKDSNWQNNLAWSQRDTQLGYTEPGALHSVMSAIASRGQIVIALHDNIGLLEDQKMLIHYIKSFHTAYSAKNHREKLVADLIDQVYQQNYAQENGIRSGQQTVSQAIENDILASKQYYQRLRGIAGSNTMHYRGAYADRMAAENRLENQPSSEIAYRSQVLTNAAGRQAKHVNEAARLTFLSNYNTQTNALLKKVIEAKNDRCKLLKTYTDTNTQTDLGSSFLVYDKDNAISGGAHAQSFANITEGMMADVSIVSGVTNCEHGLYDDWWQMPIPSNPQLLNLKLDDNLLTQVINNKADSAASIAGAVNDLGGTLAPNFATSEITHNLVVYTLTKPDNWRGAVANNIDAMFQRLLNAPSPEHARELRTILEGNHQKLTGNYGAATTMEELSPREYFKRFGRAADLADDAVERILNASGSIKDPKPVLSIAHVTDQSSFKNALENPFGGKISGAVSLLGIVLFTLNLKGAITTFKQTPNSENFFNLGSAVFGLGSGINASLMAIKPVMGTQIHNRYVIQQGFVRTLASVGMMRLFGYGGALFEGITQGMRSHKAHSAGDTDAGNFYALAALAVPLGSIAVMEGGIALMAVGATLGTTLLAIPIGGWIVGGIILLGIGIWAVLSAVKALDTPMEKWLDNSTFGLHSRTDSSYYSNEKDEHNAFIDALYAPQILDYSWNHEWIGKEDVTFEIYQPAKDEAYRFGIQPGRALPQIDTTLPSGPVRPVMRAWNPDAFHTSLEDFENAGDGYKYKLHVKNIPSDATSLTGCLFYIPIISGHPGNHWIKHCFRINRETGWGSNIENINTN